MGSRREEGTGTAIRGLLGASCVALMLCASGCATTPKDTRAADEAAVRAADAEWAKAAASKDLNATVAYYSDDASLLGPNEPIASDKESIREAWNSLLGPDTSLTWQATKVDVARSGEMAYIMGTYQMATSAAGSKPLADRGKFVEVWKKQADGNWKCVADIFNSDLAVAAPKQAAPAATTERKKGRHAQAKKRRHHTHSNGTGM